MRYREIFELSNTLDRDEKQAEKSAIDVVDRKKNTQQSEPQSQKIQMTPQLRAAIQASVPKQSDPRREAQLFDLILNQITDVNKFLRMNHSDVRHYIAVQLADSTVKTDDREVADAMKQARLKSTSSEQSRESDNNYIRQVGVLLKDDIYRVTMTRQDEKGLSHIDQQTLDAVSKNEGKRYYAKKFDYTIRSLYDTETYVAVLIENLDEASTYLIILCDLATGKIYCGRKYARLIMITDNSGNILPKRIRQKVVYNENSPAQKALFDIVVPQIESYSAYMMNRDYVGFFTDLGVTYDRSLPVKQSRE